MALFVLADPHLANGVDKPMAVFGSHWNNHTERIRENWLLTVAADDTVVLPGDISWALTLEEALPDLEFLHELPGMKILSRGNHDYWWTSLAKLEQLCQTHQLSSLKFMRNNALLIGDSTIICGSRGWILPDDPAFYIGTTPGSMPGRSGDCACRSRQPTQSNALAVRRSHSCIIHRLRAIASRPS
ncbi:MAG: metallophosphoesterase [Clostridiales bacterium]|nr:metallophosphoesterase [Clostridiales bacterium]